MPLYAYLTPKIDFKRKFNHHQSFLYEWRLTARTIRKFRIGPSLRIECRIGRTIRNRITKLRRSLNKMLEIMYHMKVRRLWSYDLMALYKYAYYYYYYYDFQFFVHNHQEWFGGRRGAIPLLILPRSSQGSNEETTQPTTGSHCLQTDGSHCSQTHYQQKLDSTNCRTRLVRTLSLIESGN